MHILKNNIYQTQEKMGSCMNILTVEAHFIKNYGNADIQKITGNIHVSYCIPSPLRINHIPQSAIQIKKNIWSLYQNAYWQDDNIATLSIDESIQEQKT